MSEIMDDLLAKMSGMLILGAEERGGGKFGAEEEERSSELFGGGLPRWRHCSSAPSDEEDCDDNRVELGRLRPTEIAVNAKQ